MGTPAHQQIKTKRVLAVDDEQEILNLYTTFLQYRGYEVTTVDSAAACLDHLKTQVPDMLLLDVNMPGIDGLKVLEMIRSDARSKDMRVIMVSARRDEATVRDAVLRGCDGFVVKPFKLEELAERIATELFQLTDTEVRALFRANLELKTNVFREPGLQDLSAHTWDAYVVRYNNANLCVMVPRGVRPGHFSRALPAEVEKRVMVFYRHPQKWKKVWPRVRKGTVD